jgi:hypothetical protein
VCFLNSVQETPQNPRNGKGLQLVAYVPEGACRKAPQHFFQFLTCPEKTLIDRLGEKLSTGGSYQQGCHLKKK